MREFETIAALRAWLRGRRAAGDQVAFVPTMGALHEGHLRLVDEAIHRADVVVMSIFVNPLQFGTGEDLQSYPRPVAQDRRLASERGVHALFLPSVVEMFPGAMEVRVVPGVLAGQWEGAARPGHFEGVLTVVAKLLHIVQPDVACFGQKDWQQVALVRRMLHDLAFATELVVVPTARAPDGLALSSRNGYLTEEQRAHAAGLPRALAAAVERFEAGAEDPGVLEAAMREALEVFPLLEPEYIAIVDPHRLEPVARVAADTIVAVAARVGRTRLIDNVILGQGIA